LGLRGVYSSTTSTGLDHVPRRVSEPSWLVHDGLAIIPGVWVFAAPSRRRVAVAGAGGVIKADDANANAT